MPFQHACFISYRHGQGMLAERIINELYKTLSAEIELLRDETVYLDQDRLRGGDFHNDAIAEALCRSVCMIVVFSPIYFSKRHTYCAREYKAMEQLEARRLESLGDAVDRNRGLIIPIVFRGWDYRPPEIKDRRQCHKFDEFLLSDVEIWRHPHYARKIKEIAEYICDRCRMFDALPEAFDECEDFTLPPDEEIGEWLEEVTNIAIPFPGRQEGR